MEFSEFLFVGLRKTFRRKLLFKCRIGLLCGQTL